jgi:CheY-like chemotaxis protein
VSTRHDAAAGQVIAEIRDTGPGIPDEIRARIFDPFFTTKPIGVGTGLGLSICHRIISTLGGDITVESHPGRGTTFRVVLPVASANDEKAPVPVTPPPVIAPSLRARIAIVDDEVAIGTTIRRVLGSKHDVVPITAAREAIARVAGGERFDVIVCDLMMPEVTGMDLHAELSRLAPDQAARMVFMTGGAFSPSARAFIERMSNARLEKPFELSRLEAIINGMTK